jgi:hypothetical protein
MSFALKLAFLLLALGAFGAYTGSAPDGGAPQTLDDGNPPPPKP